MARRKRTDEQPDEQPATDEQPAEPIAEDPGPEDPAVTRRRIQATAEAIDRQRRRIAEHGEDPDEEAWHRPARERYADWQAEREAWDRATAEAPNRTARRKLGKPPRLELPALPDFNAQRAPAIKGDIYGRYVVTGSAAAGDELAHDCYSATEACGVDAANPRTFVHFAGELAAAYPDAELHEACFSPTGD
jgi:hypothetical protein